MTHKIALKHEWLVPTLLLVTVILLASLMGYTEGGWVNYVNRWAPAALFLAGLTLILAITGVFRAPASRWATVALGLFAAYTAWTFASLLWSPNRGEAWLGAGQTLLYLLAFWLTVSLISLGASRRWVLAASVIGPAIVAALTLLRLAPRFQDLFGGNRLSGTVGYFNGEAAFLLIPLWVAVYLGGSRGVHPTLRALVLAGATLCVELAVLTQSRGALLAMAISLPVFFLLTGQRLRGLFAVAPIGGTLIATYPGLNDVYLASANQELAPATIERMVPIVLLGAAGAGLYGVLWGFIDQRWRPPRSIIRLIGGVALAGTIAVVALSAAAVSERVGNFVSWGERQWGAFKQEPPKHDTSEQQGRYLSNPTTERYVLWQVAWQNITSSPLLGVGTHNYEATYYQLRERWAPNSVLQPHSLPLEVLSERGIVGGVLFFGFLISCLGGGLRQRLGHLGSEGKAQVGALIAAVTYWFVHSGVDWFWQLPAVTLPAVVYLAMLVGPWQQVEAAPLGWPLRAVGTGVSILAIGVIAPLYVADYYLTQSYSYSSTDPEEALAAGERAQSVNPLDPKLSEQEARLAKQLGDWDRAEEAYHNEIRLNPEMPRPYVQLADAYAQRGDLEAALSFYQKALALNPLDPDLNLRVIALWAQASSQQSVRVRFMSGSTELDHLSVTVANNTPEREPALRGSATLPPGAGLMFVWPELIKDPFYMPNTTAPLDVALITSLKYQGKIVGIEVTDIRTVAQPNQEEIVPEKPYDLAIVANRGFFERNNIRPGSEVVVVSP